MVDPGYAAALLLALFGVAVFLAFGYSQARGELKRVEPRGEPEPKKRMYHSAKRGTGIFISYRRTDEPNFAGRLGDRLTQHFGNSRVFMDVDSIELGLDFAEAINDYLVECEALIAVIGKGWLGAADGQGRRRLDNPSDYVRLEIETALKRNIRVIPVIVEGAQIPRTEELPSSLESLGRRNGIEMSHANFGSDTAKLIATLDRIMKAE